MRGVEEMRLLKRKSFLVDDLVDTYALRYVLAVDDRTCLYNIAHAEVFAIIDETVNMWARPKVSSDFRHLRLFWSFSSRGYRICKGRGRGRWQYLQVPKGLECEKRAV